MVAYKFITGTNGRNGPVAGENLGRLPGVCVVRFWHWPRPAGSSPPISRNLSRNNSIASSTAVSVISIVIVVVQYVTRERLKTAEPLCRFLLRAVRCCTLSASFPHLFCISSFANASSLSVTLYR